MKKNKKKTDRICFFAFRLFCMLFLPVILLGTSCQKNGGTGIEKKQVGFVICEEEKLPDELKELIEEKKGQPFQFTFQNTANLYIVVGYGEQPRGEYVAAVRELYETEKGIYSDTTLISISYVEKQKAGEPSTYPYVVLKCEKSDKTVFFL